MPPTQTINPLLRQRFAREKNHVALDMTMDELFLCLGRRSSESCRRMHVLVLGDLSTEMLVQGLSEAMYTTLNWLTPGMLVEMCMGGSRADAASGAADKGGRGCWRTSRTMARMGM